MDDREDVEAFRELTEQEAARTAYPEGFPPLPELPGGRYTDAIFHRLETEHLWRKIWLYAGHASEVPEAGAYKLFTHLGLSIIISRGEGGQIRAFQNICRHRGAPLLTEKRGKARQFICPYHAWSYALDGCLKWVPEARNFGGLDRATRGMLPVRCENWRGLIFICLDEQAGSLREYLGALPDQLESRFPLEDMEVKRTVTVPLQCNWKVAYDNFVEIYHARMVHPTTILPYFDPASFTISLFRNGHSRYVVRRTSEAEIAAEGTPLLAGAAELFRHFTMGIMPFPNMIGALNPNGYPWVTFWPTGPGTLDMEVQLVAAKGGEEQHWDHTMAYFLEFFEEDIRLLAAIQTSLDGGYFTGMMLGYAERIIYWYHEEIDRVIGRENIPEALRMVPLLADHAVG